MQCKHVKYFLGANTKTNQFPKDPSNIRHVYSIVCKRPCTNPNKSDKQNSTERYSNAFPLPSFDSPEKEQLQELVFLEKFESKLANDVSVARLIKKASQGKNPLDTQEGNGDIKLVQSIKRSETLHELSSVLQPFLSNLGMVPTTAALVRLAKLVSRTRTCGLTSTDSTVVLSTFNALLIRLRGNMSDLDAQGVCNVIWSLSKLYAMPTISFIDAADLRLLLAQLLDQAVSLVLDMNGQNMSNLLYAVACLNETNVLAGNRQQAVLAQPTDQQYKSVKQHRGPSPSGAGRQQRADFTTSIKAATENEEDEWKQRRSKTAGSFDKDMPFLYRTLVPATLIQPLLQGSAPKLYMYKGQALSNIAWALARLGCRPTTAWQLAFLEHTARRMWELQPLEVANLTWALLRLGMRPEKEWEERLLTVTLSTMARYSYRDLANLSWSLANLGVRPSDAWIQVLCDCTALPEVAEQADASAVVGLLYALSTWRASAVSEPFCYSMFQISASQEQLPRYTAPQLCDLVRSMARLKLQPPVAWTSVLIYCLHNKLGPYLSASDLRGGSSISTNSQHVGFEGGINASYLSPKLRLQLKASLKSLNITC
ncbi:hypothetical protein CEUSTIGMA_g485.t1 [Chlamydomonas eustigma]|uniref:FAST kinase leucine-rich domain-containing protein n=1 Tax=Chlamydomonas eustigma TaxID=1157962 RepID=A0A250WQE0_9CHLO|nr:hypothetical protein CEUSTIGMA_g485.t1 [Chlamydomonas eustigma]|eukprot:GAX73033.1 hypothetical protein CEUSTIGMA_g485.t1 [Chlamydomonas eustigma]